MEVYTTAQGQLHELRVVREKLSSVQRPTDITVAVQNALAHLTEKFRTKLDGQLSEKSSLEQVRLDTITVFDEFYTTQEAAQGPSAEKERQAALAKLREYAAQLSDTERSPDTTLAGLFWNIKAQIEETDQDKGILARFDHTGGDPQGYRKALLELIEAHVASGQAGKFWD